MSTVMLAFIIVAGLTRAKASNLTTYFASFGAATSS
jgi:hypothetical protein